VTYNFVIDVPMPIELYAAAHQAIWEAAGDADHGMLVHIARATDTGFQIIEIWESKEQSDRFDAEIALPTMSRITGGAPMPPLPRDEFTAIGLLIRSAGIDA
jgi:hypothetical protein